MKQLHFGYGTHCEQRKTQVLHPSANGYLICPAPTTLWLCALVKQAPGRQPVVARVQSYLRAQASLTSAQCYRVVLHMARETIWDCTMA